MCAAIVYVQPMFIPRTRNIYPRTPIMICGCIYTIRHETGTMNRSPTPTECMLQLLRTPNVYPRTRNIYPRAPTVMRHCIYTIRCGRARLIGPLRLRNVRCDCLCTINVYTTNT